MILQVIDNLFTVKSVLTVNGKNLDSFLFIHSFNQL